MKILRNRWRKAEERVAKLEGGRTTPATGAMWHSKGDVKTKTKLIQVKSTSKKSFTVKLTDLDAIERQAAAADLEPSFVIEFQTRQGIRRYELQKHFGYKEK